MLCYYPLIELKQNNKKLKFNFFYTRDNTKAKQ